MVKFFLAFLLVFQVVYAEPLETFEEEVIVEDSPLTSKIKSFLDTKTYEDNREFIDVIFDPIDDFYVNDRVNTVKVIGTLKENGLLKLFFKKPKELHLNFKTSASPLFFVRLMDDTLRNMGYYRYVTTASNLDASEFIWNISLTSEYATDPLILERELHKSGCKIIDIQRISKTEWTYIIDITEGFLNVPLLEAGKEHTLNRSHYAYWLNVSKIQRLVIHSSRRNSWYPYIAYYDASLHLLKIFKDDRIYKKIRLSIPQNAKYIKITDLYTLKNMRESLVLNPQGEK